MKDTRIITSNQTQLSEHDLSQCILALQSNQTIILPTETVYGLAANALSETAVQNIFIAKGRPQDNPLIVHISNLKMLEKLIQMPLSKDAETLMHHFWPGPLTLILNKHPKLNDHVSAHLDTVGIRMPDHPIALQIIEASGLPLAAPSANRSGKPSPTKAHHVIDDMMGRVDVIVSADDSRIGLESTVLDMTQTPPTILRPGAISLQQIQAYVPHTCYDPHLDQAVQKPKSPGMKYSHYAPKAKMAMVIGNRERVIQLILEQLNIAQHLNQKTAIITCDEHIQDYPNQQCLSLGPQAKPELMASRLYHILNECDRLELDYVLTEAFDEVGIGLALMNRLKKAVGHHYLQ